MGMYHGSRFFAVLDDDVFQSRVVGVELKPTGEAGSFKHEPVFLPVSDEIGCYRNFENEKDAVTEVRKYIFSKTEDMILQTVVALEHCILKKERARVFDKGEDKDRKIVLFTEEAESHKEALKKLKKLRREKVSVV